MSSKPCRLLLAPSRASRGPELVVLASPSSSVRASWSCFDDFDFLPLPGGSFQGGSQPVVHRPLYPAALIRPELFTARFMGQGFRSTMPFSSASR